MTYDEFLANLRVTPRTWRIEASGRSDTVYFIRQGYDKHYRCPLTAVVFLVSNQEVGIAGAFDAGLSILGLSVEVAQEIQYASDMSNPLPIRLDLERACGLREYERVSSVPQEVCDVSQ